MQYRRANTKGGTYFFTVNLAQRNSDLLVRLVGDLRDVIRGVKAKHPFTLLAIVVLRSTCMLFGVYPKPGRLG